MLNICFQWAQRCRDQTTVRSGLEQKQRVKGRLSPFNSSQQEKHSTKTVELKQFSAEDLEITQKLNGLLFYIMALYQTETKLLKSSKYNRFNRTVQR